MYFSNLSHVSHFSVFFIDLCCFCAFVVDFTNCSDLSVFFSFFSYVPDYFGDVSGSSVLVLFEFLEFAVFAISSFCIQGVFAFLFVFSFLKRFFVLS